ncbi:MAG TPA: helix-turn-helix transcriptional regulator [Pseudonocardiaceae bacterium]|nr:helix-turn-helix transcriptional regulator [Pseudonocardiaceae bacterium]
MREHYAERAVGAAAADLLICAWSRTTADGPARTYRIVPDGCVDLIWTGSTLFVAGPDTGAVLTPAQPGTLYGVRFRPGVAPALLGLPASAITDARPNLDELGRQTFADRLPDQLSAAENPADLLEQAVCLELRRDRLDPAVPDLVAGLRRGQTVTELSERFGLTERSLHRRSVAAFGYGPKTLQRVLRFQRALRLVRAGRSYADAAFESGYADQPHLAREVRALAGVPLSQLRQ